MKSRLPKVAKGMNDTRHQVFLATLIVAAKFLNDSSPKNRHWCRYAALFSSAEVNLMEYQLLFLLDLDLRIDKLELLAHLAQPRTDLHTSLLVCDGLGTMVLPPSLIFYRQGSVNL